MSGQGDWGPRWRVGPGGGIARQLVAHLARAVALGWHGDYDPSSDDAYRHIAKLRWRPVAYVPSPALSDSRARLFALLLGLVALYIVGLDQGQLLSLVQGDIAFAQNLIHEVLHDARHTAAFPCH